MMLMPAFFPRFVRIAVGAPVLLIATSQMGLMCGPGDPGPCSSDRFNCDDGRNLAFDVRSDCTAIATPLAVEIGTGYRDFEAFGVDAPLERGSQGGQHAVIAYRVSGADLAQSDRLRVSFVLKQNDDINCGGDLNAFADTSDGSGSCERRIGDRVMVRGGTKFPLKPKDSGLIEETGVIVILDWWGPVSFPLSIEATVEDICGRTATTAQTFEGF